MLVLHSACVRISIISGVSILLFFLMIHNINNNDNDAFANVSSNSMIQTKVIGYTYNGIFDSTSSATTSAILLHPVSFSEDTLFPQTFESSATQTSDIMLANGTTLPPRPTTLTVNKIQSNNTLALSLHSLNDKYLLTGDLKGPSKPAANSTADNAQFSLTGNITVNKSKSYSVIATLAESNTKQITLTITDAKTPNNFKATIDFSPPHAATPLAE
jgi:hypothetical protein